MIVVLAVGKMNERAKLDFAGTSCETQAMVANIAAPRRTHELTSWRQALNAPAFAMHSRTPSQYVVNVRCVRLLVRRALLLKPRAELRVAQRKERDDLATQLLAYTSFFNSIGAIQSAATQTPRRQNTKCIHVTGGRARKPAVGCWKNNVQVHHRINRATLPRAWTTPSTDAHAQNIMAVGLRRDDINDEVARECVKDKLPVFGTCEKHINVMFGIQEEGVGSQHFPHEPPENKTRALRPARGEYTCSPGRQDVSDQSHAGSELLNSRQARNIRISC